MDRPLAFVINLDRSPDRLAFMTAQAERLRLPFGRIPAVDGNQVPHQWARYFAHYQNGTEPLLAPGAIGCYASHLKAWQTIGDRGLPFALVFEDDAELAEDAVAALAALLVSLPTDWDFVGLAAPKHAYKPLAVLPSGHQLVRCSRTPMGTTGYLISASGAKKMLTPGIAREWPVDCDTRRTWVFGLDSYGIVPACLRPRRGIPSTIIAMDGRHRLRAGIPPLSQWLLFRSPQSAAYNIRKLGLGWWLRCLAVNSARKAGAMLLPVRQSRVLRRRVIKPHASRRSPG